MPASFQVGPAVVVVVGGPAGAVVVVVVMVVVAAVVVAGGPLRPGVPSVLVVLVGVGCAGQVNEPAQLPGQAAQVPTESTYVPERQGPHGLTKSA